MEDREIKIRTYFDAWLDKDGSCLETLFEPAIRYTECYGPEYLGLEQVKKWFTEWNLSSKVLVWDVKGFTHQGNQTAVEWYFKYENKDNGGEMDGVSLISFNAEGKIYRVKEFTSQVEHHWPYDKS